MENKISVESSTADISENSLKRLFWLDIAKGIAIILTIVGHSVPYGMNVRNIIFSFHMPLFFLISGYTIKLIPKNEIIKSAVKDVKRLLVPVVLVLFIQVLIESFFYEGNFFWQLNRNFKRLLWGNGCPYKGLEGIGVVWFLITLFYCKFFYRIILIFFSSYKTIFIVILAFASCLVGQKIWLPQNLDLIFPALVFMDAGYFLRDSKLKDKKLILIIAFAVWICLSWYKGIYMELATRSYPLLPLSFITSLCGCIVMIHFSKLLEMFKPSKIVGFIGKYSLDLLCIHQLDTFWSKFWMKLLFITVEGNENLTYLINGGLCFLCRFFEDITVFFIFVLIRNKIKKSISERKST